jgi:methylated-DNA-[protein]-cysteine S-methyltransferase
MDHAVIETDIGAMGIGWTGAGVARLSLPGGNLLDRVSRWGIRTAPPPMVAEVVALIVRYARGEPVEFDQVALDFGTAPEFHRTAYDDIRKLKWGQTTTYGAIARRLGDGNLSRAVGQAMGANPIPLIVPCHRVLGADGKTGGFSGPGGVSSKMRMLELEQAASPQGQLAFGF